VHGHDTFTRDPGLLVLTGMWLAMMTAMMAPVAAPWVLAFSRFGSGGAVRGTRALASTLSFTAGYLAAWLLYSFVAAALQQTLLSAGLLDPQHPWSSFAGAGILMGAGAYQFAPIKRACLTHCRNPITYFLTRWRNGSTAGFRLGLGHGLFCVGCCWALMTLALVVGMTNVLWMIALTAAVFVEQVIPHGHRLRIPLGLALIAAGLLRLSKL
jgi:predicted metal-binding membrane protein